MKEEACFMRKTVCYNGVDDSFEGEYISTALYLIFTPNTGLLL